MMRVSAFMVAVLALVVGLAVAAPPGPKSVRDRIEASMLVTGEIDIDREGQVLAYRLDEFDKLPPEVVELLDRSVPAWAFKPVEIDGSPVKVRARTSILIHASKMDEDSYRISIAKAGFGSHDDDDMPTSKRLSPPRYPVDMAQAGVGGTVYLLIKVARDGEVLDVAPEQVNLRVVANERQLQRFRDTLAQNAIGAARRWQFNPPVKPDDSPYWVVRVPVDYVAPGHRVPKYGEWYSYVPGPRAEAPWEGVEHLDPPETLVAGGVYGIGKRGPELLTPLASPES
ncbi:energy transducer TonB [Marilutibacter alkalisoli]|uniref:Protein tonB n=1 Tax=Marilutibacter alkalisoli TaxID=2591633 RepID=A0A514BV98_9GAMM|nr:protein tonB [Lysobacter alkalisoli]QDH71328.1 protein tonB [Lysobacter alkalisoli]